MATFKSSGTDKDVKVQPTGTGKVVVGTGAAAATVASDGDNDLVLQTGNATTGSITVTDGADGDISLTPNGTGAVVVSTQVESDTIKPTTTNGSLKLRGDSGGSATTNGVTVNNLGNVGIGIDAPLGALQIRETSQSSTLNNVSPTLVFNHQDPTGYATGNYYNVISFSKANSDGTTKGAVISALMEDASGSNTALVFGTGSTVTERMRINSSGNVEIKTGNLIIDTAGQGITFGGDPDGREAAATAAGRTLYDYEEGSFSFAIRGTAGTGYYTKIGRLVNIQMYFNGTAGSTPDNSVSLPFANAGPEIRVGSNVNPSVIVGANGYFQINTSASSGTIFNPTVSNGVSVYFGLAFSYYTS